MNLFKGLSGKFLIPYALTLVFGLWTYVSINNILRYQRVTNQLQQARIYLLEMQKDEKDFMSRDFRNPEFLTSGKSSYIEHFHDNLNKILAIKDELESSKMVRSQALDSMSMLLTNYAETYLKLTLLMREKGFKDWGLEGELRATIHAVEKDETTYDRAYMLMLRRHEKDFFLRYDPSYLDKFNKATESFIAHIDKVVANASKRADLVYKIGKYQRNFERIVDMQRQIGLTEDDGLYGELNAAVQLLTPFVDELFSDISQMAAQKTARNKTTLIILFILITVLVIVILNWHIRKITRNINIIRDSSRRLSLGEFPEKLRVNSRDELGQAHHAINVLTDGLRSKAEFAEAIGRGDLDAQLQMLSDKDILARSLISMKINLKKAILETNEVVDMAGKEGDLEARIKIEGKEGAWRELAQSVNQLLITVSSPLVTLNWLFHELADGNLSIRYEKEANGHIALMAHNTNTALDQLSQLLRQITNYIHAIDDASRELNAVSQEMNLNMGEIASAVSEMSSGAQRQVAKVDATSGLIEGILQNANDMSQRAEAIHQAAGKGVKNSQTGTEMVNGVVQVMSEITTYSDKSNAAMTVLSRRSNEINEVIRVINDISTQTNLLALNAAIEAAQAGEAGRGFAVLAEEIRKLADGTRRSTQEISQMIADVKRDTLETAKILEHMTSRIVNGEQLTRKTAEVFAEMAVSSEQTLTLSENILTASQAQKEGVEQIVRHTESIVVIAEQTAAGTEESATSVAQLSAGMSTLSDKAQNLSQIAEVLNKEVSRFILNDKSLLNKKKKAKEEDFELV